MSALHVPRHCAVIVALAAAVGGCKQQAADAPPPAALQEEDRSELLAHPDAQIMSVVFAALWEGAPTIFGQGLETLGVTAQDRISPVADLDLARVYSAAAKALGNRQAGLYMGPEADDPVRIACHAPPAIVVSPSVESTPLGEQRFLLEWGQVKRALAATDPGESSLLIGHEPDLSGIVARITGADHSLVAFGTGTLAGLEVAGIPPSGPGVLNFMLHANQLASLTR